MSQQHSGPDWTVIGGALATIAGIAGAAWAGLRGRGDKNGKQGEEHNRLRLDRDTATTNTSVQTLQSASWLVEQLQEEITRKGTDLDRCAELTKVLMVKVAELEHEIFELRARRRRGTTP